MKLYEVYAELEKVAPKALSDEFCKKYKLYDNSGVLINFGAEQKITGALFTLDLTEKAVAEAVKKGYNLIVTHHPVIYGGISQIDTDVPLSAAIAKCVQNKISIISMHLNFDAAPKGIDHYLMCGLGGKQAEKILAECALNGAYGRVYGVKATKFSDYVNGVKTEFNTQRVWAFGDGEKTVKKVASFCGAGCDEQAIAFAVSSGADVFVSADMKHHEILALTGRGICVIVLTHYASENYGFNRIYSDIGAKLTVPSEYFTDSNLL